MTYQTAPLFDRETFKRVPAPAVFALSILFHVFFLVVIPLLSALMHHTKRFERPKTFQLVASPFRPSRRSAVLHSTRMCGRTGEPGADFPAPGRRWTLDPGTLSVWLSWDTSLKRYPIRPC